MLPREQGGVVDANLRVYGLSNVRVADASVPPIALSTHLMASTYGVAEQASIIIREFHNQLRNQRTSSSQRPSSTAAPLTHSGKVKNKGSGLDGANSNSNHGRGSMCNRALLGAIVVYIAVAFAVQF